MPSEADICRKKIKQTFCKDRISALPEDLLVQILCLVPTKDAVTTMILSKRWRFVWTMLPKLEYTESDESDKSKKSVWNFLDKSLQLHKAPSLERLCIQLGSHCPVDVNVGKWVLNAVDRYVRELKLHIDFIETADPTSFPKSLYTCRTLVKLTLSGKILVDVPSLPCLPYLESLVLSSVVYKDQDSHVKLLSSCPVLKDLVVVRNDLDDNVTRFSVKVPSLQNLTYMELVNNDDGKPLVIDSPGLKDLAIIDTLGNNCLIQNMPRLDTAMVTCAGFHHNDKFLASLSSVMFLYLASIKVASCSAINFSRLIEFHLRIGYLDNWLEPLVLFLHNAPKLKTLMITTVTYNDHHLLSWNQPSSVPGCLLSHLEIFEWDDFTGTREESQFLAYILTNSKCLKTVGISLRSSNNDEEEKKIMEDLKSMYRVSASSQLLFSTNLRWGYQSNRERAGGRR